MRRYTFRQFRGYLDAVRRRRHTDRSFGWDLAMLHVAAAGGQPSEFPDYVSPEEGQDPDELERALERRFAIENPDSPPEPGVARRMGA